MMTINNENTRRVWLRRILEVILFCALWVPIALSGIHNFREQIGKGYGAPSSSVWDKLSGWGLWLAGAFIWYFVVSAIGRFVLTKLGFLKSADEAD
jgi:hypothetical protein